MKKSAPEVSHGYDPRYAGALSVPYDKQLKRILVPLALVFGSVTIIAMLVNQQTPTEPSFQVPCVRGDAIALMTDINGETFAAFAGQKGEGQAIEIPAETKALTGACLPIKKTVLPRRKPKEIKFLHSSDYWQPNENVKQLLLGKLRK